MSRDCALLDASGVLGVVEERTPLQSLDWNPLCKLSFSNYLANPERVATSLVGMDVAMVFAVGSVDFSWFC